MTMEERDRLEERVQSLPHEKRLEIGKAMMFWAFGWFYDVHNDEVDGWYERLKEKVDAA